MNNDKDRFELAELNRYVQRIGQIYGASNRHFKDEDSAERLPPPYHQFIESKAFNDYGLRLYCIRLTTSTVILLNGGRKTSLKVQDCPNCFPHFNNVRMLSNKINNAILDGFIEINLESKEIELDNDFELII
ncbi:hypothetical protein [Ferruginibacter albus]|uniref:hypothetical protein n=1 Tax=Ferruginibacter albus TaxID=2875540 RepID=UPI001CC7C3F6|nr:hypothetical protein [Ferruginibacter albus]UAY52732.1 hypothetical protein K9M53_03330 [Ferruginibacter albus]